MNPRTIILLALALAARPIAGQVRVDAPVLLESPDPALRQVTGLVHSGSPASLLTAGTEQEGAFRTAVAAAGGVWDLSIPDLASQPVAGTHLMVKSPGPAQGAIMVRVNGHGPYPVTLGPAMPADGGGVPVNTMLSLVFDGAGFQMMNGAVSFPRPCPAGLVAVSDQSCIEVDERPVGTFYQAALACTSDGLRLCGWGEFYSACIKQSALGVRDLQNGYEWTGDTADSNYNLRIVGAVGQFCSWSNTANGATTSYRYRCCYSR